MILLKEYPVKFKTQSVAEYAETVAKAQLKKAVKWGDEDCPHAGPRDDDPIQQRKHCNACWLTLLKEVE